MSKKTRRLEKSAGTSGENRKEPYEMTDLERARMHAAQAVNRAADTPIPASSHTRSVIECVEDDDKLLGHARSAHLLLRDDVAEARYHLRQLMSVIDARLEFDEEFSTAGGGEQ